MIDKNNSNKLLKQIWYGMKYGNYVIIVKNYVMLQDFAGLNFVRANLKRNAMNKYSKKASEKIGEVMHEFQEGTLKSGKNGSGGKVKSRKQAIAIGISEAREAALKVPAEKASK